MVDSISGTPAIGTIGLGIANPPWRSRLPSPAAMMPPANGALISRIASSSRSERICRSSRQHGLAADASAPTSQMWRIPTPRAPAMSRGNESPTKVAFAAETRRGRRAPRWKIRGAGFVQPTSAESTITLKQ